MHDTRPRCKAQLVVVCRSAHRPTQDRIVLSSRFGPVCCSSLRLHTAVTPVHCHMQNKYCYRQAEMGVGDCGGLRVSSSNMRSFTCSSLESAVLVVVCFAVDSGHDQVREAKDAGMAKEGAGPRGGQGGCSKMRPCSLWFSTRSGTLRRSSRGAIFANSMLAPTKELAKTM